MLTTAPHPEGAQSFQPMPDSLPRDEVATAADDHPLVRVRRATIDKFLIGFGVVAVAVLALAGSLLTWGHNFANDYVANELGSQKIFFPAKEALQADNPALVKYAGQQVTTGKQAEAYAKFINGHLAKIGGGMTYSELGKPETAAKDAVTAAKDSGASAATVADLQAKADGITAQRNTVFKGETLRGLLLSTYAWSTIAMIAGIAAIVSFIAAAVVLGLVVAGFVHLRRSTKAQPAHAG